MNTLHQSTQLEARPHGPHTDEHIITYLEEKQGIDPAQITSDDTELFSSGLLDSFSMVDLIMFIETEAGSR